MKKIKKLLLLSMVLFSVFGLIGCAQDNNSPKDPATTPTELTLKEVAEKAYEGDWEKPKYEVMDLTKENFESYAFTEYKDTYEAVTADALIGSIAHSVVLVRVNDAEADLDALVEEIKTNANPRKWICVEAESVEVVRHDNVIMLVMSNADTTNKMVENFNNIWK